MTRTKGYSNAYLAGLSTDERIMLHIKEEGGHWLWQGAMSRRSPQYTQVGGKPLNVRRTLYIQRYGAVPKSRQVRNRCGEDRCVLPEHQEATIPKKKLDAVSLRRTRAIRKKRVELIEYLWQQGYRAEEVSLALGINLATVVRIMTRAAVKKH